LNLLVGNIGRKGGILPVAEPPVPEELAAGRGVPATELGEVADGSIAVLIIDADGCGCEFPERLLESKIAKQSRFVVSFSSYKAGLAGHADYILPAPAHMEILDDVPNSACSPLASFSITVPLMDAPEGAKHPAEYIAQLATAAGVALPEGLKEIKTEELLKKRADAIYKTGRGEMFNPTGGKVEKLAEIKSAADFWKALKKGACWFDAEPAQFAPAQIRLTGPSMLSEHREDDPDSKWFSALFGGKTGNRDFPLVLMPFGWRGAASGALPPLLTKLYRDSDLRASPRLALINPETAAKYRVADGQKIVIETIAGDYGAVAAYDASVMPGVIQIAAGPSARSFGDADDSEPGVLSICEISDNGTWRITRARLREA